MGRGRWWYRAQCPSLPMVDGRPHSSGQGVCSVSHKVQKGPSSATASSGQSGAEQRRFLAGSYTHALKLSSLRQQCWRFSAKESLQST